jgi:hypothetical protein
MRRVLAIAAAGLASSTGGCSSFSTGAITDYFKSTPPAIQVQLESMPPGAEAKTSLGPTCKTPCAVSVSPPDNTFAVTYTLNRFQPTTVQVNVVHNPGDLTSPASTTIDPNPVIAELHPAVPPHKGTPPKSVKKKKSTTAQTADSPFPDPAVPPPPGTSR